MKLFFIDCSCCTWRLWFKVVLCGDLLGLWSCFVRYGSWKQFV